MELNWDAWRVNMVGWLGRQGEVFVVPEECPRGKSACEGCPAFMGHKLEGDCYSGQDVPFCCGDNLASSI